MSLAVPLEVVLTARLLWGVGAVAAAAIGECPDGKIGVPPGENGAEDEEVASEPFGVRR
jgi:hypothetical protein